MAKRLLLSLNGEWFNPYRKWQGPHWTLYSLAEIGFPARDERLLLVMAEMGMVRDPRCQDALELLERRRLIDGAFPVEWTNVTKTDRIETRGTFADWGTIQEKKGNALVTVDALYVLREGGRAV